MGKLCAKNPSTVYLDETWYGVKKKQILKSFLFLSFSACGKWIVIYTAEKIKTAGFKDFEICMEFFLKSCLKIIGHYYGQYKILFKASYQETITRNLIPLQ